jgi:hypothetical protein
MSKTIKGKGSILIKNLPRRRGSSLKFKNQNPKFKNQPRWMDQNSKLKIKNPSRWTG